MSAPAVALWRSALPLRCLYAQVIAIDISDDALAVTQMNIQRFAVEQRVQLCRSDLLTALPQQAQPIDVIIANLPYIPTLDIPAKT